jgi:hypothetical protein
VWVGQVGPTAGGDSTLIAFGSTIVTVAGGIVVGYLALMRDKRKDVKQEQKDQAASSQQLAWASEMGRLAQAVEDLTGRVDSLEHKVSRRRTRDNANPT